MSYDLVIKNGTVVDGTGAPRYRADVAVTGDRIAEIGKITESGKKTIDATDLIVSPGFVDPHTHYDAQICWDPLISCTSWHGITSVVMGNCGVGVAPCKPDNREITAWDLTNVEAIPFDSLSKGVTWDWETFPQFLDAAARRGSGINLGFLAPLTPFRHYVMGKESMERAATEEETKGIAALLSEAVGGRCARLLDYHARAAYRLPGIAAGLPPRQQGRAQVLRQRAESESQRCDRSRVDTQDRPRFRQRIRTARHAADRERTAGDVARDGDLAQESRTGAADPRKAGATDQPRRPAAGAMQAVRGAARPAQSVHFRGYGVVESHLQSNRSKQQKRIYSDPAFRESFRKDLMKPHLFTGKWHRVEILEVTNPALKPYERKTVAEVADIRRKDPLDTFLDLAIEDDLSIQYTMAQYHEEGIRELINDPRTMLGLSDGGAHVDMLCDAGYATYLLGNWVRERQAMTLEHAVKRITSEPADFFGIRERGRLNQGWKADITLFDPNTVNSAKRAKMQNDLPGGGRRLVMPAEGIEYTIVNGSVLYDHGKHSGRDARPGDPFSR